jgi:hypothetical protein
VNIPLVAIAIIASVALSPGIAAAKGCSPAAADHASGALKTARAALASLPVQEMATDVDQRTQVAIETVKDRVQGFVDAAMACAPPQPDAGALQRQMADNLVYDVRLIAGASPMIGVTARFPIQCGSDSLLMLFQRKGGAWTKVMVRRSAPYRSIAEAWEELEYDVSEPDAGGRWFLVTAHVNPWCVSVWQNVRFDVARPGTQVLRPKVLLSRANTINIEDGVAVEAGRSLFTVRYDGRSLDPDVLTRRYVERYRVVGDRVSRVDPLATNPRDFVDEWIRAPWAQALQWSSTPARVRAAHERLSRMSRRATTMLTFASVRACKGGSHQVEIGSSQFDPKRTGPTAFALVSGEGRYRLQRVSAKPFQGCGGPDLKEAIKPFWSSP